MLKPVKLGSKIELAGVPRYTPTKGITDFGFICHKEAFQVHLHYIEGIGNVFCNGGLCCELYRDPISYNIYLFAQYDGNTRKNLKGPLTLKHLRASHSLNEQIKTITDQLEDPSEITKIDLSISLDTGTGEQYKKMLISTCPDGKRVATKEMLEDLKLKKAQGLKKLENSIALSLTDEQLQERLDRVAEADGKNTTETKKIVIPRKPAKEKAEEIEMVDDDDDDIELESELVSDLMGSDEELPDIDEDGL